MGYHTRYELTASEYPNSLNEIIEKETDGYFNCLESISFNSCKWYEHEKHMKKISINFPEIHFTLHGMGEENDDIWEKHFVNGKMQICRAQIVMPPFDENKLENVYSK